MVRFDDGREVQFVDWAFSSGHLDKKRAHCAGLPGAERNCISNIRPAGLAPDVAARHLAWHVEAALAA